MMSRKSYGADVSQAAACPTACRPRRAFLTGAIAITVAPWLAARAHATPESMAEAMAEVFGPSPRFQAGRIKIQLPELAENGNAVPLRIQVESAMTPADHVQSIFVFSEKNPVSNVARFHLTPRAGTARIYTNIRLAATQTLTVVARMSDGSLWQATAEVIVTQAACIDGT